METERTSEFDPREQLRAFQEGAQAAESEAHVAAALWLWPAVSLLCPAFVAFRYLDGILRVAVVALLVIPVVAVMTFELRRELSVRARVRTPARGGRFGRAELWRFPAMFCFVFSHQTAILQDFSSGLTLAACTYAFSAIGTTFFWWKADRKMIERTTAAVYV